MLRQGKITFTLMEIESKICPRFSLLSQKNSPSSSSAVIYSDFCSFRVPPLCILPMK